MILLGIITTTAEKRSSIYIDERADFPLVQLKLCKTKSARKWIKKLANCGVSRVVVSEDLHVALNPLLNKNKLDVLVGHELLLKLNARIALAVLVNNNISFAETGVEIYGGKILGFEAIDECSRVIRYVSVCGCGSEELTKKAGDILGVSVISGLLPEGLCKNILRLYFDGRETLFTIRTGSEKLAFENAEIILPEKYAILCDSECTLGFAQALVQSGKIRISQIKVENIQLGNY